MQNPSGETYWIYRPDWVGRQCEAEWDLGCTLNAYSPISISFRHPFKVRGRVPLSNRNVGVDDPYSADANNHGRHDNVFE